MDTEKYLELICKFDGAYVKFTPEFKEKLEEFSDICDFNIVYPVKKEFNELIGDNN